MRVLFITDRKGVRHTIFLDQVANVMEYLQDAELGEAVQVRYVHGHGAQNLAISVDEWEEAFQTYLRGAGVFFIAFNFRQAPK
jgi:hypothetical protein